jgi:hypothetical protein
MDAIRAWIETQSNWLLVLDNADALHHYGEQYASHSHDNSKNLHSFIPRCEEFSALKSHHFSTSLKNHVSSKQLLIWQAISKCPSYTPQHNIFHGSDPTAEAKQQPRSIPEPPFKRSATERTPSSKNPSSTLSPTKRSHSGGW